MGPIHGILRGCKNLVRTCGNVQKNDKVLIITDEITKDLGQFLVPEVLQLTNDVVIAQSFQVTNHGLEPEDRIAYLMQQSTIIFGLTRFSIAHTKARMDATLKGARYLSLPDYSLSQLESDALNIDFVKSVFIADKIKTVLDKGSKIKIITAKGSNLSLSIKGRIANSCPGICNKPGMLGSPPDIETNIAPEEHKSDGVIVVDGSIPCKEIGLVKRNIGLKVEKGFITRIDTNVLQGQILDTIFVSQPYNAKNLAEFGIGLNPRAKLCGRMLEDEGCLGTIHFGFGSNATIGGKNKVNFHLDFVIKMATVFVDDKILMENGNLLIL